jgi:hypothetical protein
VTGIGPVRAKRKLTPGTSRMMFLHSNGVGTARAVRIYKTYGSDAVQVMTENPYRLTRDVRGIGFETADAIAMRLGIERTAMIRLRAGVSFALAEATGFEQPCEFDFTSRQIEIERSRGDARIAIDNIVNYNQSIHPIGQSWQRTNNRPTAGQLNISRHAVGNYINIIQRVIDLNSHETELTERDLPPAPHSR